MHNELYCNPTEKNELDIFLEKHSITYGVKDYTHTSMHPPKKYFISDEDLSEFYRVYTEKIKNSSIEELPKLTEKAKDISPIRIDFDFRWKQNTNDPIIRRYNSSMIRDFCKGYMKIASKWLSIADDERIVLITEKPNPIKKPKCEPDENNDIIIKDGVHIHFPLIMIPTDVHIAFREAVLNEKLMNDCFDEMKLDNNYCDVFDKAVLDKNPWMMYGSRKKDPTSVPYELTEVYIIDENNEIEDKDISDFSKETLTKLLSVRAIHLEDNTIRIPSQINITKQAELDDLLKEFKIKASKINAPKGPKKKKCKPPNLKENDLKIMKMLVNALSVSRARSRDTWIQVGWALHNIDNRLLEDWISFSKKPVEYKATAEFDCTIEWNEMYDEGLTQKSLRYWVQDDDINEYKKIQRTEAYDQIMASLETNIDTGDDKLNEALKEMKIQPYDVAKVLYTISKDEFICVDPSRGRCGQYFYFKGHRWEKNHGDVLLRERVSEDIPKAYINLIHEYVYKAKDNNEDEKFNKAVEDWKDSTKRFTKMLECLKNTTFKDQVMKEAPNMFMDKTTKKNNKFLFKLDNTKHLIGFDNGVYNLLENEFRDGRPEDYISLSTNIEYNDEFDWDSEEVVEVMEFISQVLPDEDVREYVLLVLASFLNGDNKYEKFFIWTGSGGNGKSKLIELFLNCLGDYGCTLPISLITQKRKSSGEANPEVARTMGRRFAVLQEPDVHSKINVGLMKEMSGGDVMMARELYSAPVEFKPQFKMVLTCNQMPELPYEDEGTWRRVRAIQFKAKFLPENEYDDYIANISEEERKYVFKADGDLSEKFDSEKSDWPSALMWILIQYYQKWTHEGLKEPESVIAFTQEYKSTNDKFRDFYEDNIIKDVNSIEPLKMADVWISYRNWLSQNVDQNDKKKTKKDLQKYLEKKLGEFHGIGKTVQGWIGYRLNGDDSDSDSDGDNTELD